jgi:hypothetical protein
MANGYVPGDIPMQSASVIACRREHLIARCKERGVSQEAAWRCVVSESGDSLLVDVSHPAYPSQRGPGTELKRLLASFGITSLPGCSCNRRAAHMDRMGCEWCEANESRVVGWLREEAARRGLPFIDAAGRVLVRRAIAKARQAENADGTQAKQAKDEGGSAV